MRAEMSNTAGSGAGSASGGGSFEDAMRAESSQSATDSVAGIADSLTSVLDQMKDLIQQLSQLLQSMNSGQSGASIAGPGGTITPVDGGSGLGTAMGGSNLGGEQGASARIPDPTQNVREVQIGSKTMTIGSDGSASAAEVDAAVGEMQRMYDVSPTFRNSIESSTSENLTMTLGRRGDNTSWGGGARVFLNLNNIEAGNNDSFQGIVAHEFAHAANGLPHGGALDAIESAVQAEA